MSDLRKLLGLGDDVKLTKGEKQLADLIEQQQARMAELEEALHQSLIHWGSMGVREEDGIAHKECGRILDLSNKDKDHE